MVEGELGSSLVGVYEGGMEGGSLAVAHPDVELELSDRDQTNSEEE